MLSHLLIIQHSRFCTSIIITRQAMEKKERRLSRGDSINSLSDRYTNDEDTVADSFEEAKKNIQFSLSKLGHSEGNVP